MKLDDDLKSAIREIFESSDYYGRSLSDNEVQEIADNLVSYGELLIGFVKGQKNVL